MRAAIILVKWVFSQLIPASVKREMQLNTLLLLNQLQADHFELALVSTKHRCSLKNDMNPRLSKIDSAIYQPLVCQLSNFVVVDRNMVLILV